MRLDGRATNQLREIKITPHFNKHAEGSVLMEVGDTRVICTATIEEKVPNFLRGQHRGWINAEYAMLPRATHERNQRESTKGRPAGRTMEIQRLIARALRSVVDLKALGERTITVDCDVIQADGGTRTAAITGGFVALTLAVARLNEQKLITGMPIVDFLASTSVGIIDGHVMVDLNYTEDSKAHVDLNLVMTGNGAFVEVQGTGEQAPFTREQLQAMLAVGESGIHTLIAHQRTALGQWAQLIGGISHASTV